MRPPFVLTSGSGLPTGEGWHFAAACWRHLKLGQPLVVLYVAWLFSYDVAFDPNAPEQTSINSTQLIVVRASRCQQAAKRYVEGIKDVRRHPPCRDRSDVPYRQALIQIEETFLCISIININFEFK